MFSSPRWRWLGSIILSAEKPAMTACAARLRSDFGPNEAITARAALSVVQDHTGWAATPEISAHHHVDELVGERLAKAVRSAAWCASDRGGGVDHVVPGRWLSDAGRRLRLASTCTG
jgi:hypothetical protein